MQLKQIGQMQEKGPRDGSRSKDNDRTTNTSNWENFAQRERVKGRKGNERNANMTNEERIMGGNEIDPERVETDPESCVGCWDVNFTASGEEPASDLDWAEIENFGTDSEVEQFLQNNEETQGYEDLQTPTDVESFKIFSKEQIARGRDGKKHRSFRQFGKKLTGALKGKNNFWEMQASAEKLGERNLLRETNSRSENGGFRIKRRFRTKEIGME